MEITRDFVKQMPKTDLHVHLDGEALESNLEDESFISDFLDNIAEQIVDPDERTVGLRMFCAVVLSDGITAQERQRCYQIGDLFEFHHGEVDEIIDEMAESLASDD